MSLRFKLVAGALFIATAFGYLAFLGAASNWQYYLSVDEVVADQGNLSGRRMRVSGRVVPGTLSIAKERREASFDLAGQHQTLSFACRCTIPDNLAEDAEVVVEGMLQANVFRGEKVITRCASKYEPKAAPTPRPSSPVELAE
jgi:cytochrome c-type biogenesis protein CcmE